MDKAQTAFNSLD
uniref:Uncharacterized protein n=1 Tax=Arundo donax TaxID=35708 RepID=A0A0A8YF38_ARUDO